MKASKIMTPKLKERFCKDIGVSIKLFDEPYFSNRLNLYDKQFNTISKYEDFIAMIEDFDSEQDYLTYHNKLKDKIIEYIADSEAMRFFKEEEDMNQFVVKNTGIPKRDIYRDSNCGKSFISIDMVKANFTAIRYYNPNIFGGMDNYEDFIGTFTNYEHLKTSKQLRQIVFGMNKPKRQITYQRHLMDLLLTKILKSVSKEAIASFSNDEIVIELTGLSDDYKKYLIHDLIPLEIESFNTIGIKTRQETFELIKIEGTKGYIKRFLNEDKSCFKCLDSIELPFVLRSFQKEEIKEEDKVFMYERRLAKLLEVPNIEFKWE